MHKQSTVKYANKHANKSQTHRDTHTHTHAVNEQNEHSKTHKILLWGNQLNLCIKKN